MNKAKFYHKICYNNVKKKKKKREIAHAVCAEVTYVIAAYKHGDHFPVIVEIDALKESRSSDVTFSARHIKR